MRWERTTRDENEACSGEKKCSRYTEHAPGGVSHLAHSWAAHVGASFMTPIGMKLRKGRQEKAHVT